MKWPGKRKQDEELTNRRISRFFDAMLEGIMIAMCLGDPPEKVAGLFRLFVDVAHGFGWERFDGGTFTLIEDLKARPELPVGMLFHRQVFGTPDKPLPPPDEEAREYVLRVYSCVRGVFGLPQDPAASSVPLMSPPGPAQ